MWLCFQHVWRFEVSFCVKMRCSLWLQSLKYDDTLFETSQTMEVVLLGGLRCSQIIVCEVGFHFNTRKSVLTFLLLLLLLLFYCYVLSIFGPSLTRGNCKTFSTSDTSYVQDPSMDLSAWHL